jgi:hypothetical protein
LYQVSEADRRAFFTLPDGTTTRKVVKSFKGHAPVDLTYEQDVSLVTGTRYRLTCWAFPDFVARYTDSGKVYADDPYGSQLWLGTDRDGRWFAPGHGNLEHGRINELVYEFIAQGDTWAGFGAMSKWGLVNNGVFWWGAKLEAVAKPEPPTPEPGVDYVVVVNLLPQDATRAEFAHVLSTTYGQRESIVYSAHDAARLVAPGAPDSFVRVWAFERWGGGQPIDEWLSDRGVEWIKYADFPSGGGAPEPPPVTPTPTPPAPATPWNVTGVHASPVLHEDTSPAQIVARLQENGVRAYKLLYDGQQWVKALAHELAKAGIQPIIRLYCSEQGGGRNRVILQNPNAVRDIIQIIKSTNANMPAYIEVDNERNIPNPEWPESQRHLVDWHNKATLQMVASSLLADWDAVIGWGGSPAFTAMAPTDRNGVNDKYSGYMWQIETWRELLNMRKAQIVNWLKAGTLWIAVHPAMMARPIDWNPVREGGRVDDMCLRGYQPFRKFIIQTTGITPTMIGTESGVFSPHHLWELWPDCVRGGTVYAEGTNTPLYSAATWPAMRKAAFDYLGGLRELKYLTMWHFRDGGGEWDGGGWYTQNWVKR